MLYRDFATQEELDEQYNVRKAVPDHESRTKFYVEWSNEAREQFDCQLNVPFGPTVAEHLDIFPTPQSSSPILIFIHGGYWHSFSSKEFAFVAKGPVSAGVTTILTNYALCPKVNIGEIIRQSRAAIAWVYQNADAFGGDRTQIYVSGHSAGGHLTAMLALTNWEEDYGMPNDIIKGIVPISGLFDLAPFPYSYLQPKLQCTWGDVLYNSPILHIPEMAPPLMLTYGSEETSELRRQSTDFLAAWRARGLEGDYLPQPGKDHFSVIDGFLDVSSSLCATILRMIE